MFRSSQDGGGAGPDSLPTRLVFFFLKSSQNETIWLSCYSLGACGIVEMPRRVGTPAANGPAATAHFLAALSYVLSRWPFPLNLSPKNVVIWSPRALSVWHFFRWLVQRVWASSGLWGILGMYLCHPKFQLS